MARVVENEPLDNRVVAAVDLRRHHARRHMRPALTLRLGRVDRVCHYCEDEPSTVMNTVILDTPRSWRERTTPQRHQLLPPPKSTATHGRRSTRDSRTTQTRHRPSPSRSRNTQPLPLHQPHCVAALRGPRDESNSWSGLTGLGDVSAFGESQQTVVGQRLPTGGICDELSNGRPDSRVIVERSHADADRFGVTGIRPVDRRSAFSAEPLFSTAGRLPHPQRFLTGDDPEGSRSRMCLRRGRSTTSPLTPFAVAVARPHQRCRDLVADSAAITPTGEWKPHGTCRISHALGPVGVVRSPMESRALPRPRSFSPRFSCDR